MSSLAAPPHDSVLDPAVSQSAADPIAGVARRHPGLLRRNGWRSLLILGLLGVLVPLLLVSIAIGTKQIPLGTVVDAIFAYDPDVGDHDIIRSLRVPRTIVGALVGTALGVAGTLMQGLTRNPIADPGILGVNAGASLAVVIGIYVFGIGSLSGYIWFAFIGAAVTSFAVYTLGSLGREGATPVKLALAGAAITAMFASITSGILLSDLATLDQFRFWVVGSLQNRMPDMVVQVAPFLAVGLVGAMGTGRVLNALALGDDVAASLGQRVGLTRIGVGVLIVLLVGGAVSIAGPIAFVGLAVPHIARAIVGPDYRWILPCAALVAPILLLGADIIGRVIDRPDEIQVGIVTAVLGAPFFIALVRYRKLAEL